MFDVIQECCTVRLSRNYTSADVILGLYGSSHVSGQNMMQSNKRLLSAPHSITASRKSRYFSFRVLGLYAKSFFPAQTLLFVLCRPRQANLTL